MIRGQDYVETKLARRQWKARNTKPMSRDQAIGLRALRSNNALYSKIVNYPVYAHILAYITILVFYDLLTYQKTLFRRGLAANPHVFPASRSSSHGRTRTRYETHLRVGLSCKLGSAHYSPLLIPPVVALRGRRPATKWIVFLLGNNSNNFYNDLWVVKFWPRWKKIQVIKYSFFCLPAALQFSCY